MIPARPCWSPTSLRLPLGEAVAAVGFSGAGGEYLAEAFARLLAPAGRTRSPSTASRSTTCRSIYGPARSATSRQAPTSRKPRSATAWSTACASAPQACRATTGSTDAGSAEALAAGNTEFSVEDDWMDYEAAGASGPDDLIGPHAGGAGAGRPRRRCLPPRPAQPLAGGRAGGA